MGCAAAQAVPSANAQAAIPGASGATGTATPTPPYLTLILGRTLYQKGCTTINDGKGNAMLTLDYVVPYLWTTYGVGVTGPVIPDRTPATGTNCVNQDTYTSWQDLASLKSNDGLTVVSASQSYSNMTKLTTTDQQFQQSCGSLNTFIQNGFHRAWGLFAYPNNQSTSTIQSTVVQYCYAYGRLYAHANSAPLSTLTNSETAMVAPWYQTTADVGGGRCVTQATGSTFPCHTYNSSSLPVYMSPVKLASLMHVSAGYWTSVQFYSFVTGTHICTGCSLQWDCSSSNSQNHWTSKFEVYCWNDLLYALAQKPSTVVVTDPATVAEAWGRIPTPLVTVDSVGKQNLTSADSSTTVYWHGEEYGTYRVLVGGSDCSSGTPVASGAYTPSYTTPPAQMATVVNTSNLSAGQNAVRVCLTNDASHTGYATTTLGYAPAPTVTGVSPPTGPLSGTSITITGTNFTSDATVTVGGAGATVNSVSATQITATAPSSTTPRAADVVVSEAGGTSQTSSSDLFTYEAAPVATSISPAYAGVPTSSSGPTVTITGSNFYPDASVTIGGVAATNVSGGTSAGSSSLTATAPGGLGAGTYDVVVSEGGGHVTMSAAFTYEGQPAFGTVAPITPTCGTTAGGDTVTISGSNFYPGDPNLVVTFGGAGGTVNVASSNTTTIVVTTPPDPVSPQNPAGDPVDVVVSEAGGTVTQSLGFTYSSLCS